MLSSFFIWCAGTDRGVLSKTPDAERTKHIGYGTLVLIPAVLGFISMSYALSTIDIIKENNELIFLGGFIWGAIIFAFDRFIVSTHRKRRKHIDELKNPAFFLRFFFALVMGMAVSHPFVLLWFDGSISQEIISERNDRIDNVNNNFQSSINLLSAEIDTLSSRKECLERVLFAEQSGHRIILPCGSSSGIPKHGTRAKQLKESINKVENEINIIQNRVNISIEQLNEIRANRINDIGIYTSFDYLKRELILQKIINENKVVWITQIFIILLFILVDLLPLIFKTFAPFGIYDKTFDDDGSILTSDHIIDTSSRKKILQKAYNEISRVYADKKQIDKTPDQVKEFFRKRLQKNVFVGLFFGSLILTLFIIYKDVILEPDEVKQDLPKLFSFSSFLFPIVTSILGTYLYDIVKNKSIKS